MAMKATRCSAPARLAQNLDGYGCQSGCERRQNSWHQPRRHRGNSGATTTRQQYCSLRTTGWTPRRCWRYVRSMRGARRTVAGRMQR